MVKSVLLFAFVFLIGLTSVSAVLANPKIERVTIAPTKPLPLSTINFNATIQTNETIDEVRLVVQECRENLCFVYGYNISMEKTTNDTYAAQCTLIQDEATQIKYYLMIACNDTWYTYNTTIIPLASDEKKTIYVGGNGSRNYSKIQDALDNITAGGTVYVFPGTYHENLIITTPVHLMSNNKESTIIDGGNESYVVILEGGNITLSGFTIIHSEKKFPFAGIYVDSNHNTISDNILTDNFYGMQLGYAASYNLIVNTTIYHNGRCGVYFNHASHNNLIGNVVSDHPVNGFGLFEFSNNNSIMNNTFSENRFGGVTIVDSYDTKVISNTFIQNQVGFREPPPEYHTIVQDNIFTNNVIPAVEERDAFVFTVVVFSILVFSVYLIFRKLSK